MKLLLLISFTGFLCFTSFAKGKTPKLLFTASNENLDKSYQLNLWDNKRFSYFITQKDSSGQYEQAFAGIYKMLPDGVLLTYLVGKPDSRMTIFLKKEITGHYFIQNFHNSYAKEFLRIQQPSIFR